ncbi:nucleoside/nucleotide kinase family protein [Pantoea sp. A4]|uniref:nucleoside/nucleotide kinase family protein n=1 Tax=Pantoea sp. A4 TaxID=1225184 RepID=UPI000365DB20|nr:nucleoside/nucleotide kinase family protein [Pantoea sp. A4]
MSVHSEQVTFDQLLADCQQLLARGGRQILGIAGAPGSGKSTLAQRLCEALSGQAVVVPMDGFHLANLELQRLNRAGRKGAPDTFDSAGYQALLRRLRQPLSDSRVYAPAFHREIEEPIAGEIGVAGDIPLVITEGNYLLLSDEPWQGVRALLDSCWFLDVDEELEFQRLLARHMQFGRSEQAARDWIAQTDLPNARRIIASRTRADRCLTLND